MIVYSQTSVRQRAPAPKAPEPEPVKKRHQGGYRMSAERFASLQAKYDRIRELWPTHTSKQIAEILGYSDFTSVNRIGKELGLPSKGRGGRR